MICTDPYMNLLAEFGYATIRLPRANLAPLTLLEQVDRNSLRMFGTLEKVLPASTVALPVLDVGRRVANLSGRRTSGLSVKLGLSLLGGVAQALGGSPLSLETAYKNAKSIAFGFDDILEDSVEVGDLDLHMNGLPPPNGLLARRLIDEGSMYVVTSSLGVKKLTVSADFADQKAFNATAPAIHGLAAVSVGIEEESGVTWTVAYQSDQRLKFAFKAIQVVRDGGMLTLRRWADGGLEATPGSGGEANLFWADRELVELVDRDDENA